MATPLDIVGLLGSVFHRAVVAIQNLGVKNLIVDSLDQAVNSTEFHLTNVCTSPLTPEREFAI